MYYAGNIYAGNQFYEKKNQKNLQLLEKVRNLVNSYMYYIILVKKKYFRLFTLHFLKNEASGISFYHYVFGNSIYI